METRSKTSLFSSVIVGHFSLGVLNHRVSIFSACHSSLLIVKALQLNLMHVDSNSLPQKKNRSSATSFLTQLSFDRVVYFLGAGHQQIVVLLSHRRSQDCSRFI